MSGAGATKRRRIALIVLSVLALVAGYFILRIVLFVTAKPTISVNYATEYNERLRPANLDPNDNAAPCYRDAFALLPSTSDDIWRVGSLRQYEPNSIMRRTVESWIASCDEAMQVVHQAAERRAFWAPLSTAEFFDPMSMEGLNLNDFRTAAFCLRLKAESLTLQGDIAGAFDCVVTVCRIARHLTPVSRAQFFVGSALNGLATGTAFDVLSRRDVESGLLGKVQAQLDATLLGDKPPSFVDDEIRLRDVVQRCFTDDGKGNGRVIPGILYDQSLKAETPRSELAANAAYLQYLYIAWVHPTRMQTLQTSKTLIERANELVVHLPWELWAQRTSYDNELTKLAKDNYFLRFTAIDTTLARTIGLFYRMRVHNEALIATMGVLRFHKDKGVWPASLEELAAAGYIRAVPIDPYSGKPLVYRPVGDSFTLYSYGLDFDDDGGVAGQRGNSPQGSDQVFWPVEERKK